MVDPATKLPDLVDNEAVRTVDVLFFREDDEIGISTSVQRALDSLQTQHFCRC